MNKSTLYFAIALLIASTSAFSINRGEIMDLDRGKNLQLEHKESTRSDMPCANIYTDIYKAFQFYSLIAERNNTISNYPDANGDATLYWNMCTSLSKDKDCSDMSLTTQYGYLKYLSQKHKKIVCIPIYKMDDKNNFKFDVFYSQDKNDKNSYKVDSVSMTTQIKSNESVIPFSTIFNIKCGDFAKPTVEYNNKKIYVNFTDKSACGVELSKFLIFFQQFRLLSVILILLSIPLIFFGLKFIKKSLAILGFIAALILSCYITTMFANFINWETKQWVIFSLITLVFASIIATACYLSPTMSIIIGGGSLGYFGAQQLFILYAKLANDDLPEVYQGVVFSICVGLGVVLAWKLKKICTILATSLGGAYLFTFGLGSLIGNYPDLSLIEIKVKKQDFKGIDTMVWVYFGITIVLFLAGAFHQFSKYNDKTDEDGEFKQDGNNYQASDDYTGYY